MIEPIGSRLKLPSVSIRNYLILLLLWIFHVVANLWWLKVDTRPPFYDSAGHSVVAIFLSRLPYLTAPFVALDGWLLTRPYPPFTYSLSVPFAYLFWPTTDALMGSAASFLALLLLSTYEIGRRLASAWAGMLAAFLLSFYPILYGLARHYLLDVPLVSMVTFSICCLIWSETFQRLPLSLLFGLSFGLGMLTKWTFAIFVVGPLLLCVVDSMRRYTPSRLRNLIAAGLLAALIATPWYIVNRQALVEFLQLGGLRAAALEGDPLVGTWDSWTYYLHALVDQQILLPFAVLFLLGLTVLVVRRQLGRPFLLLLLWIGVPYIAFSNYDNKDVRYTMPYLPAVALVTSINLMQFPLPNVQKFVYAGLGLYSLLQFAGLTFGLSQRLSTSSLPFLPARLAVTIGDLSLPWYTEYTHIASPPRIENWQMETILLDLMKDVEHSLRAPEQSVHLTVVPAQPCFEPNGFIYYVSVDKLPIAVGSITGIVAVDSHAQLAKSDYVVTKTGDQGPPWMVQDAVELTAELGNPETEFGARFRLLHEYPLPDGSVARLYKQHPIQ